MSKRLSTDDLNGFYEFVENRPGAPSIPGVRSWGDLARRIREMGSTSAGAEKIQGAVSEVRARYSLPLSKEPSGSGGPSEDPLYDRWTPEQRLVANEKAVVAYSAALARGEASIEQRAAMLDYTGFGGFQHIGEFPETYPAEYVQASKEWEAHKRFGSPISEKARLIRSRVLDQFFTPMPLIKYTWKLLHRLGINPKRALEPSAGIGRFLRYGPSGIDWTLVEMDDLLAGMLRLCYPTADVFSGTLEDFVTGLDRSAKESGEPHPGFDLILGNPPYGARSEVIAQRDPRARKVTDNEEYFILRSASLLAPEGTLCFLVRHGSLTIPKYAAMRRRMVQACTLRAAAILPSKTFKIREGTFSVQVWTRRAVPISPEEFTERDQAIVDGSFLDTPEGQESICGGKWKTGSRGLYLEGNPDYDHIERVPITAPDRNTVVDSISESPRGLPSALLGLEDLEERPVARARPKESEPPTRKTKPGAKVIDPAATALVEAHIRAYLKLVATKPQSAESYREPTRVAVLNYISEYGNPHPSGSPIVRSVVARDGTLEPILSHVEVTPRRYFRNLDEQASFSERVEWFCEQQGYALPSDLEMEDGEALERGARDPDVFIEFRPEGPVLLSKWAYFTGSPGPKLKLIDAALGTFVKKDNPLTEKLELQKKAILERWSGSKTLGEIDVTPRSPFVPKEALEEWVNRAIRLGKDGKLLQGDANEVIPPIELLVQDGIMSVDPRSEAVGIAVDKAKRKREPWNLTPLYWLIAYFNRDKGVENLGDDKSRKGEERRIYESSNAREIAAVDRGYIGSFQDWLGESSWASVVEAEYNMRFAPSLISEMPTSPIYLAGQGDIELRSHQTQIVRRVTMGGRARPFLFAGDVGVGKCVVYNTKVLTSSGLLQIGDLFGEFSQGPETEAVLPAPEGLRVLSHIDGEFCWTPIRALYRQRVSEDLLRIQTSRDSSVEVTKAHPLPVLRDGRVVWLPAGEVSVGDNLVLPSELPEPPNAVTLDPDVAALIAWQLGDGHENGNEAKITQKDELVLESLLGAYSRAFQMGATREGNPTARIFRPSDPKRAAELVIRDPNYKTRLEELDYPWGSKSSERRFPSWFSRASNETLSVMLRAFFDAEGTVSASANHVSVCSASRELIEELRYALLRFGVRSTFYEKASYARNSSNPVERTYYNLVFFGEDAENFQEKVGFGVPEKAKRLAELVSKKRNPNSGIPILGIVNELSALNISMRMLTGFLRGEGFKSASRATVQKMVDNLTYRLSVKGLAEAQQTSQGRKTAEIFTQNKDRLQDIIDRLQALLSGKLRFERVEVVTSRRHDGFVYDIEVDRDSFGEKNYVAGEGGMLLHNTFTGVATAAKWVQSGACRRVLIAVPASVVSKWYADARRLLPTARIGVIGITPGKKSADDADTRLEKWLRFAAGGYDFCITTLDSFINDLEPEEKEVLELVSEILWARKQVGKTIADRKRKVRKVEDLEEKIEQYQRVSGYSEYKELHGSFQGDWAESRDKQIAAFKKNIIRLKHDLETDTEALGTDKEVASVLEMLARVVSGKPYRPSSGKNKTGVSADFLDEDDDTESAEESAAPKKKVKSTPLAGLVSWSDLGVDGLIIDEAHRYKNLFAPEEKIEYAGAGKPVIFGTKRPWDLLIKSKSVHRKHGGIGGVMLLTATPMTNSPLELYGLMTIVNPELFPSMGIHDPEAFIHRYWEIKPLPIVKPSGEFFVGNALVGFKNLDELMGVISGFFERLSVEELVKKGWLDEQPTPRPIQKDIPRDVIQTMLVRTLVALRVGWTRTEKRDDEPGAGLNEDSSCFKTSLDLSRWTVDDKWNLVQGTEVTEDDAPPLLKDKVYMRQARSVLNMIWQSLLDKIALDPRLVLRYASEIDAKRGILDAADQWQKYFALKEKNEALPAKSRVPNPQPTVEMPSTNEMIRISMATALLDELPLDKVERYYRAFPVVPKVRELVNYIVKNIERPGKGRCGHVIFVDAKEIHGNIAQAIVAATAHLPTSKRITLDQIAFVTSDTKKPDRLIISSGTPFGTPPDKEHGGFNGRDEIRTVDGEVLQTALPPKYHVVIGTTGAMGEGIDLQKRSCAVHHLDLPWHPAGLHQRNGRAVRQGNRMGSVDLLYFITKNTFDGLRYDKIGRKREWWNQVFEGLSKTTNPGAEEDAEGGFEERILRLVVEDEDELEKCLASLRAERKEQYKAQVIQQMADAWFNLNAQFEMARKMVDPLRRESLMKTAVGRRRDFELRFGEEIPKGAASMLNDHAVAIDWSKNRVIVPGDVFETPGQGAVRIVDVEVKTRHLALLTRSKGSPKSSVDPVARYFSAPEGSPWALQEELSNITDWIENVGVFRGFADLSKDLWPHAMSLFRKIAEHKINGPVLSYNGNRGTQSESMSEISAIFLMKDKVFLGTPGKLEKDGFYGGSRTVSIAAVLTHLLEHVTGILPLHHPDAWPTWVRAFRTDKVLIPGPNTKIQVDPQYNVFSSTVFKGGMSALGLPTLARLTGDDWLILTSKLFGLREFGVDVLRQRFGVTGEDRPSKLSRLSR